MPYFLNNNTNILFIHIPKNAGTSIEFYLSKKHNILLNEKSLYMFTEQNITDFDNKISLQHQTLSTYIKYKDDFNINFNNIFIFCVVRNPYTRLISDLFFYNLITNESTQNEVYNVIISYFTNNNLDNHNIPQYKFITDDNNQIYKNVNIFKFENLKEDMIKNNFTDFDTNENIGKYNKEPFLFLNNDSIQAINKHYEKDFIYFNYEMKINI
jgi:hypothetical protein